MVGNDVGLESPTYRNNCGEYRKTVITRSDKRRSNLIHIEKDEIATFRYTPLAMTDKRLRNKCAMTCVEESILSLEGESGCLNEVNYNHERGLKHELINNEPSPALQAPSAQGRQGHTHRTALRFPLSPQVARGKIRSIGNMKENIFSNKVYSLFTTHLSIPIRSFHVSLFTSHEKQLLGNKE